VIFKIFHKNTQLESQIFEFCRQHQILKIIADCWKKKKEGESNRQEEQFVYAKIRENLCPENDLWNQDLTLSAKHPLQSDRLIWYERVSSSKRDYMDTNKPDISRRKRIFYYKNHI